MLKSDYRAPFAMALIINIFFLSGVAWSLGHVGGAIGAVDDAVVSFDISGDDAIGTGAGVSGSADGNGIAPAGDPTPAMKEKNVSRSGVSVSALTDENGRQKVQEEHRTDNELTSSKAQWGISREDDDAGKDGNEFRPVAGGSVNSGASGTANSPTDGKQAPGQLKNGHKFGSLNKPADNASDELSFLSPVALGLLSPGNRDLLIPSMYRNPKDYLERVGAAARASTVTGNVVVRVTFGVDGSVEHATIPDGTVSPEVEAEALRIVQTSGGIINNMGHKVMLPIPVTLGQ